MRNVVCVEDSMCDSMTRFVIYVRVDFINSHKWMLASEPAKQCAIKSPAHHCEPVRIGCKFISSAYAHHGNTNKIIVIMGHGNDDYTYDDCELWSISYCENGNGKLNAPIWPIASSFVQWKKQKLTWMCNKLFLSYYCYFFE